MNLHALVRGVIATVNPDTTITLKRSAGYTTGANGKQAPLFASPVSGPAQIQPMGKGDLRHMNDLNITGIFRKVYLYGHWMGSIRADKVGGDVLSFPLTPGPNVESSFAFLAPKLIDGLFYLAPQFASISNSKDWKVVDVLETWPGWCCVAVVMQ